MYDYITRIRFQCSQLVSKKCNYNNNNIMRANLSFCLNTTKYLYKITSEINTVAAGCVMSYRFNRQMNGAVTRNIQQRYIQYWPSKEVTTGRKLVTSYICPRLSKRDKSYCQYVIDKLSVTYVVLSHPHCVDLTPHFHIHHWP